MGVLAREFYNEELTRKRSKTVVTDEKEAVWVDVLEALMPWKYRS